MKKNLLILTASLASSLALSQTVGINTPSPQTTLDVRGVNHLGTVATTDGVLVPRVNSLAVAGSINGQLVYLIQDTVTPAYSQGFHYWDGTTWSRIQNSLSTGTQIEHTSLTISPPLNMNTLGNNNNNWTELPALKKSITVSLGAKIDVTVNATLANDGPNVVQADLMLKITPDAVGLPSTISQTGNPRDTFAVLYGFVGNFGQSTTLAIAKSIATTTSTSYTVQVYVARSNTATGSPGYFLNPAYVNILATK